MQLMPATAKELGVENSLDPRQNVMGGAKYLRQLIDQFDGNLTKVIAGYNAGPGAVDHYGGVPPYPETQNYVAKVLKNYEDFKS
jgi:soluble lytic murein transglycosylase-like protein